MNINTSSSHSNLICAQTCHIHLFSWHVNLISIVLLFLLSALLCYYLLHSTNVLPTMLCWHQWHSTLLYTVQIVGSYSFYSAATKQVKHFILCMLITMMIYASTNAAIQYWKASLSIYQWAPMCWYTYNIAHWDWHTNMHIIISRKGR